ncbi:MAG: glycoside hydrolase family 3 N-terminal domain-containing protein [Pseudomonadota bacterium]
MSVSPAGKGSVDSPAASPDDGAAVIFGCAGVALSAEERALFRDVRPWGFILFARNIGDPDELLGLTDALRDAAGWHAPILIDQEGGRVARLRGPLWRDWPPVGQWCAAADAGDLDEAALQEALRLRYALKGAELRAIGVDVNCAPLLDLRLQGYHEIMGDRALGETPAVVGPRAKAVAEGLEQAGVLPVVKHLPGHGRALVDSHHDLPTVDAARETLSETDFAAFKPLAGAALGMTAHVVYEAVDAQSPATLSAAVVSDVIRGEIGFDGLLMTDDVGMGALSGSEPEKARGSLAAGCDVVLHCSGDVAGMAAAEPGLSALSAEGRRRSERALAERAAGAGNRIDIAAAETRLTELTGWRAGSPTAPILGSAP